MAQATMRQPGPTGRAPRRPLLGLPAVIGAFLRRLRFELPLTSTVMGVVLVSSLIFAAAPRLYTRMSQDGLRYDVTQASVFEKDIVMTRGDQIPPSPGSNVFAGVNAAGAQFQQSLPKSIQQIVGQRTFVIDAVRYRWPGDLNNQHLTLRYQSGINDYIKLVSGRLPAATKATVPAPADSGSTGPLPVIEAAMTPETAKALNLKIGDTVTLEPDPGERLVLGRSGNPPDMAVRVVGFIETLKQNDDYWYEDPSLQTPTLIDDGNQTQIYGTALFAPSAYGDLLNATAPGLMEYTYRFFVAPKQFTANSAGQLRSDLHRLTATYGDTYSVRVNETGVTTNLGTLMDQYTAQRRLTGSILSLAAIGLLVVSLAVIGLVAAFIAERRREATALLRGRGASVWQILGTQAVEGLLLCIPMAVIGYALALLVVHSEPNSWSIYAAIGIVVATTVLLVATARSFARRNLGTFERDEVRRDRFSARRAALEIFIVVLAAAGIYLLRRRGLAGDSAAAESGGFDPYLAAVPVLLGLATGLVALRLWVLPVRLLSWNASFRRDLVPFLGFRRTSRQSLVTSIPLLVILLSVAVGVFSAIMLNTIEVGQVRTSWQRVGADYRIDPISGTTLDGALDLSKVPGVTATAGAYEQSLFSNATSGLPGTGVVTLLALDPSYEKVTKGTPVDAHLPAALLQPVTKTNLGTAVNPIPAIVSRQSPTNRQLNVGDVFALQINQQSVTFIASDVRAQFVGLQAGQPFVVAPLAAINDVSSAPGEPAQLTQIYVRAPASAYNKIQDALNAQYSTGILTSRAKLYDEVHNSPLVAGAVTGFEFGIVIAAAYSALSVVVALALTGRERRRDLGYLRTLGLSPRQVIGLMAVEQAPPVILALAIGVGLGVGITRLIAPGLDFTAFTGPDIPVSLTTNWFTIIGLVIGLIVVVSAAVAVVSLLVERMNLNGVLRLGDR